ncbi:MAG: O-antigen ligase [Chlamydiales bacterium]|jgi:O-antigen ligase
MTATLLASIVCCVLAWRLSGAPGVAYLLFYLAFLPFLTLDPEGGGAESVADFARGGSAIKAALRALTSIGFLVLLVRRRGWFERLTVRANWPVLLFLVWAVASLVRAPSATLAAVRLGELATFFLAGLVLLTEADRHHDPRDVLRWRCLATVPVCVATLLAAVLQPELMAFHDGPGGVRLGHRFIEANVLGFSGCVLSLWSTYALREARTPGRSYLRERGPTWILFALGLLVVFFARSRTAMITWILGQLALWLSFSQGDLRKKVTAMAIAFPIGIALVMGMDLVVDWVLRGGSVAELASATGRTDLWLALLRGQVLENPIFGAGYLALGPEGTFYLDGRDWNNAHNTFIFALVSNGLPGLILLLAISWVPLAACARQMTSRSSPDRAWVLFFILQLTVLVTGLTGFGICGHPNVVMLFSFALYPYCAQAGVSVAGIRRDLRLRSPPTGQGSRYPDRRSPSPGLG